jgi:RNA polymerase sigma-70 factor, ECF subfamily
LEQLPDLGDESVSDEAAGHLQRLREHAMELVQAEFEPRTWQMFWQVVAEGRATHDVAAHFGVSPSAVRLVKSRVMRRLREQQEELLDED